MQEGRVPASPLGSSDPHAQQATCLELGLARPLGLLALELPGVLEQAGVFRKSQYRKLDIEDVLT